MSTKLAGAGLGVRATARNWTTVTALLEMAGESVSMRRYTVADVFTDVPLQGNQVAVFTDATGLSRQRPMQRAAREMNLSETVFVLRSSELPRRTCACGSSRPPPSSRSPVIRVTGTAFVVGRAMGSNVVRLETGLGVVPATLPRTDGGAPYYGEMEQLVPAAEPFERGRRAARRARCR